MVVAAHAEAAAAELARVTAPTGRIVFSAWIPDGAMADLARVAREAVRRALEAPAGPPPFSWHDPAALAALLGPHDFAVSVAEERLAFTGASPRAYVEAEAADHPLWVAGRPLLEARGESASVLAAATEALAAGNEDPAAFRVTSRYVVVTAWHG